jgi:hypothetical protein
MSLFSFNRPSAITWSLTASSGTVPAFNGSPSLLTNGRPAMPCRTQWPTGGTINTAQTLTLTGALNKTIVARSAALLFPSQSTAAAAVPAGCPITCSGKLSGVAVPLGGNALTTTTVQLPNGAVAIWFVFPRATIDTIIFNIPNSNGSTTWATSAVLFDIGEAWIGEGADFQVAGLDTSFEGGVLQRQSHNNQAWPLQLQAGKGYSITTVQMSESIFFGPNGSEYDWETVEYALSTQSAVVIIPAYMKRGSGPKTNGQPPASITSALIDSSRLQRMAKIGVLEDPGMKSSYVDQLNQVSTGVFGETPP